MRWPCVSPSHGLVRARAPCMRVLPPPASDGHALWMTHQLPGRVPRSWVSPCVGGLALGVGLLSRAIPETQKWCRKRPLFRRPNPGGLSASSGERHSLKGGIPGPHVDVWRMDLNISCRRMRSRYFSISCWRMGFRDFGNPLHFVWFCTRSKGPGISSLATSLLEGVLLSSISRQNFGQPGTNQRSCGQKS